MDALTDHRALYALAGCLLVLLPMMAAGIPPITDLPQQLAQVPLAAQTIRATAPELHVQWLTPNKLSYPLLALGWFALSPLAAARLAIALIAATWLLGVHLLAARRRRPVSAALLAGLLIFNHVFYLGLLNFIVGLSVFLFWFELLEHERHSSPRPMRTALLCGLGGLLLYMAHALWLAAGLGWLALVTVLDRRSIRWQLATVVGLLPTLTLVLLWYPSLGGAGWGSLSSYGPSVIDRISFAGLTNSTLGGLTGWIEPLTMVLLACWLGLALWQHRHDLGRKIDHRLLTAAALFLLLALLLPDKIDRTLRVASRWMPVGVALLILSLPAPAIRPLARRFVALTVAAIFCLATTATWRAFDRQELGGLRVALTSLPEDTRLLGLDFVRSSPRLKGPVYMHLPAYAQLMRGSRLGFSFVSLASSLVVKRDLATPEPWSQGLEWAPQLLRSTDLGHFDHLLIHASPNLIAGFVAQENRLAPLTGEASWRLFAIEDRPAAETPAP
jgi:hypothetical protein